MFDSLYIYCCGCFVLFPGLSGYLGLIFRGLICQENMQIEGFWYYIFTGVFEAATIHYAVAKIFRPLILGRGWCGVYSVHGMCEKLSFFIKNQY